MPGKESFYGAPHVVRLWILKERRRFYIPMTVVGVRRNLII